MTASQIVTVGAPMLPDPTRLQELIQEALATGWLTNGGLLHQRLQREVATLLGVEHLGLVSSGTMALMMALRLGNLPEGAEVITTPLSFPATVQAIRWCGFRPVFADVDPQFLSLCPKTVEAVITPRTAAILPVHFLGVPADVDGLAEVGKRHGLWLVYDAAHAFGLTYQGRPIAQFGDASAFSLHATKLLNTAEGGAVVLTGATDRAALAQMRNFGMQAAQMTGIGTNAKLSEMHAAIGLALLPDLPAEMTARKRLRALYDAALSGIDGITLQPTRSGAADALLYYSVRLAPDLREALWQALSREQIFARGHFPLLCGSGTCLDGIDPSSVPVAARLGPEVLCLPFHGQVSEDTITRIARIARKVAGR